MKKKLLLGALCIVMVLSLVSCDGLFGSKPSSKTPFQDTDYITHRKDGRFKKIPEWAKGYWSDDSDDYKYQNLSDSCYLTDTNFFQDIGREELFNISFQALINKIEEDVTATTYTITMPNYYKGVNGYESHTSKDWVFKIEKTSTGISVTEIQGDSANPTKTFTKGKLFLPAWIRNTKWVSGNGKVELDFSVANLIMTVETTSKMDFTETILPVKDGNFCEYTKGKGYIESYESGEKPSYQLVIADGSDTLVNKFVLKDANTLTWIEDGEPVGDFIKK